MELTIEDCTIHLQRNVCEDCPKSLREYCKEHSSKETGCFEIIEQWLKADVKDGESFSFCEGCIFGSEPCVRLERYNDGEYCSNRQEEE